LWSIANYQKLNSDFKEIIQLFESRGGKQMIDLEFRNFKKIVDILTTLYNKNKDFSKNKGLTEAEGGFYNLLIEAQIQMGFTLVNCLCVQH
jgi:hypothetical protein